jgi:hypothetical protein
MKKSYLLQTIFFGLALVVYFISSPPKTEYPLTKPQQSQKDTSVSQTVIHTPRTNTQNPAEETIIDTPAVSADPVLDNAPVAAPTLEPQQYIEVSDSCGPYFGGDACVNVRTGPGTTFPVVTKLRKGVVLRVVEKIQADGREWYKITFKEYLRYPERVSTDWYIAADFVEPFMDEGTKELQVGEKSVTAKKIIVDRSEQTMYAYDGDNLFMEEKVSTGIAATPTPRGVFTIFKKTPSRYMQGPIEGISTQYYDLPGVPWDLYFTYEGAVFHGAYWHDEFGKVHSNGCVNLPVAKAKELYAWADLGTQVIVRD